MRLFFLLVALNILDAFITFQGLKAGGAEQNRFMRKIMDIFGEREAVIGSKMITLGLVFFYLHLLPWWLMSCFVGVYTLIVLNNLCWWRWPDKTRKFYAAFRG